MKILVLCEQYASLAEVYKMAWAHSRNTEYAKKGHQVHVLNFNAHTPYHYDGVEVLTKDAIGYDLTDYDIVISHAPNIKNHFFFLLRVKLKKIIFFFHGHEVLYTEIDYPEAYKFKRKDFFFRSVKSIYDFIKIKLIKLLIHSLLKEKSHLIFVSTWMRLQYEKNINIKLAKSSYSVIANPVWHDFVDRNYIAPKHSDKIKVLTLRKLDNSKYAMDLVLEVAKNNLDVDFYVYGNGDFFKHFSKPDNVFHEAKLIHQSDLADFFNGFDIALLPTRYDSQGVLACEMATYGMPLITSDIDVAKEMLNNFENVIFMNNCCPESIRVTDIYHSFTSPVDKKLKFSPSATVARELKVFQEHLSA